MPNAVVPNAINVSGISFMPKYTSVQVPITDINIVPPRIIKTP